MQALRWLGAPSPGGLALPAAHPTAANLYGPRGVCLAGERLLVADTGNHRVLIWNSLPTADHAPADVILGQPSPTSEGPNAGGPRRGMNLPTSLAVVEGNLVVADAWNHRLLVWDGIPQRSGELPSLVLGQPNWESISVNAGRARDGASWNWPFAFLVRGQEWLILDTGNRRVLGYRSMPVGLAPADWVLGQPDASSGEENRGAPAGPRSFRWPHGACEFAGHLWIADAGNHRILGWPAALSSDADATHVLGQPDFHSNSEFVLAPQGPSRLRFPYGLATNGQWLAAADTANNRVLCWRTGLPFPPAGRPADHVFGQPDFFSNGENHWKSVTHNSLCWPYGLAMNEHLLAVADSGNNRILLWQLPALPALPAPEIPQEVSTLCA